MHPSRNEGTPTNSELHERLFDRLPVVQLRTHGLIGIGTSFSASPLPFLVSLIFDPFTDPRNRQRYCIAKLTLSRIGTRDVVEIDRLKFSSKISPVVSEPRGVDSRA